MPLFRDLNGKYFLIPDAELKKFAISEDQAAKALQSEGVAGMEAGELSDTDLDGVAGGTGTKMHQKTLGPA